MEINPRLFDKHGRLRLGRGGITCARWHPLYPEQPYLAVGLSSGEIIILRVEYSHEERRIAIEAVQEFLPLRGSQPCSLDWGPQRGENAGRYLAVAEGACGFIRVLDVEENRDHARFPVAIPTDVIFSPDGKFMGVKCNCCELRVLRFADYKPVCEQLSGSLDLGIGRGQLAFHPGGVRLATSNPFGILDVASGEWQALAPHGRSNRCRHISFSPNGCYLLTEEGGDQGSCLVLRSAQTGIVNDTAFGSRPVSGALSSQSVWGPQSDRVLIRQRENNDATGVRHVVMDVRDGRTLFVANDDTGCSESSLSPNGALLALIGGEQIALRYISAPPVTGRWKCGTQEKSGCFSPGMCQMCAFAGVNEGKECIWRELPNMQPKRVCFHDLTLSFSHYPVFTSDAQSVVIGTDNGQLLCCAVATDSVRAVMKGHESRAESCAVSADARYFASISESSDRVRLLLHDLTTGAVMPGFPHDNTKDNNSHVLGWQVAVSPDGKRLMFSSDNETVVMSFSGGNGQPLEIWKRNVHSEGHLRVSAFSPDGRFYVENRFFNDAERLFVYNAISGGRENICDVTASFGILRHVAYSPCGRWVVCVGSDSRSEMRGVELISSVDWQTRVTFDERHRSYYDYASFSPCGRYLAVSGLTVLTTILDLERVLGAEWFAEYHAAPLILTAVWFPKGSFDYLRETGQGMIVTDRPLARCGECGRFFPVDDTMLGQELRCPNDYHGRRCNRLLKLNPFIAGFQDPEVC